VHKHLPVTPKCSWHFQAVNVEDTDNYINKRLDLSISVLVPIVYGRLEMNTADALEM